MLPTPWSLLGVLPHRSLSRESICFHTHGPFSWLRHFGIIGVQVLFILVAVLEPPDHGRHSTFRRKLCVPCLFTLSPEASPP